MTLFHFVNCSISVFAPYYIIYDGYKLSKNEGFTKLFFITLFYYFASQIVKLFALAFLSIGLIQSMTIFNIVFQEAGNFFDLIGLYYVLSHKQMHMFNIKSRILSTGLSWGFCESVATNFFPFLIGGKSVDFSLKHIYRSISANTFLVSNLSKTYLLYLWINNVQNKKKVNSVNSLLIYFTFILPLINKIILINEDIISSMIFIKLIALFLITFILFCSVKYIFNSQNEKVEIVKSNSSHSYVNDVNVKNEDNENDANKGLKKKYNRKKKSR
ncbi:conserved membrane protein, unknown function [Plasmodium berghei]|uniref:BOS complex subunit TMEM147 n=2 Tax=Plasmodium berghei TaxID=5821 RepID=A0A509ANA4_PLABA|nr:transmembrane protein 147, putative [Plasmodium berghei ANKA]CXI73408.1 conserved membrane protein, unknown function [Plasmodium berghei]SCM24547.1 conserved membrane protein, unknown function [Plasmodium berghei]SCN27096.1 conserved membrane protein, unknown function [Plasmodium berghei]SCO61596.1 conserved membrane protein, unknown function [Plasmodium berghei]SCO63518.1 conserved membrane protein, unknown function [Plasmodium berghei]|eukprot:XP_034422730.1 transmembrane protein 147, putative [Plasmodium berghei ANKA]